MVSSSWHGDQRIDDGLDVIHVANELLDLQGLFLAGDTASEPDPTALPFDPNAGALESTVGQDRFLDARDDLLVIQVGVW